MKTPQTRAETIGKYGCLAMCYLYCVGIGPEKDGTMIEYVSRAMDAGLLDDECTVLDASRYLQHFTGKWYDVIKKDITDISDIKDPTPVRYSYNGRGHWVVVEDGKIVFNPLQESVRVANGAPDSARIIRLRQY